MVVAGIVNPSCVRRPGEGPHSPAHGVARLAVLVRRLWSSECERRGGRLYLLSTLPDEGRPWAERSCALAFYGRRGAVGFVPQPWPSVAPAPPLTDDRTAPAVEDTCAVCLEPLSSRTATSCPPPTPTRALRRVVGAWGGCAARMPSAVSATPAFRRRAPAARYAATRAASVCSRLSTRSLPRAFPRSASPRPARVAGMGCAAAFHEYVPLLLHIWAHRLLMLPVGRPASATSALGGHRFTRDDRVPLPRGDSHCGCFVYRVRHRRIGCIS